MKNIVTSFLIITLLFTTNQAHALVTTVASTHTTAVTKKKHKLKFKEKAALWILKRKIKKNQKHNPALFQNQADTTDCATILLTSGDQIKINLIETTESSISFTRCNSADTITLSKSDISQLKLADGLVIYKNDRLKKKVTHSTPNNRIKVIGVVAVLASFLGTILILVAPGLGFLLGLMGLILGIIHTSKTPIGDHALGIIGIILGIIALGSILITFALMS